MKSNYIKKFLIVIIIIIVLVIVTKIRGRNDEISNNIADNIAADIADEVETPKTVEEIKNETGATASDEMYEIQEEYDGRKILTIKPDVQYKTVLAGILKNSQPTENDIKNLDFTQFHNGIWISEISRDKFLQVLKECGIQNFEIDEEGYLKQKEESNNKYSKKLQNLIQSEDLTIIDITGTCYTRDEMTGEIVEYPFKDMDLYQICEKYEVEGSKIIIVTTNPVDSEGILDEICN